MKSKILEKVTIPDGIDVSISQGNAIFSRSGKSLSRKISSPGILASISGKEIVLESAKGGKKEFSKIKSEVAHINNIFTGLNKGFVYTLESCNVHFPMTLKLEKNILIINNFLGEKVPRTAKIHPDAKVDIKGVKVILSSHNKEAIGQTMANIERATKIKYRDRRVFQDGIYLVSREDSS